MEITRHVSCVPKASCCFSQRMSFELALLQCGPGHTYMYTFLEECGHIWPRPHSEVVWVIGAQNGAFTPALGAVHLWSDHTGGMLIKGLNRACVLLSPAQYFISDVLPWNSKWHARHIDRKRTRKEKVWVTVERRAREIFFEEGLVILGGLLWPDVSFDVTVRPQELQPPLMLPARYFCQYSVYRARHSMWCSCPWLKSTVVSGKQQSGQKPQTITFAGSPFKILKSLTVLYFQFWSVQRQNASFWSITQTVKH